MSRLTFPNAEDRLVYYIEGASDFRPRVGALVRIYSDSGATTLADIQTLAGAAITNAELTVDANSLLPQFLGPDGVDTLYAKGVGGSTVTEIHADVDSRLDAINARITSERAEINAEIDDIVTGTGFVTQEQRTTDLALDAAVFAALNYDDAKFAAYSFGNNNGAGTTTVGLGAGAHQRIPFRLTVQTSRWRVKIRNYNTRLNTSPATPGATVGGIYLATPVLSADGSSYTGAYTSAPTLALAGFSMATDASEYVSSWVEDDAVQIAPNRDYMLAMSYTLPTGGSVVQNEGLSFYGSGTAGVTTLSPTLTQYVRHFFDIQIEYEFVGNNPVEFFIGDSITDGFHPGAVQTKHAITSYPQQHASLRKTVAVVGAQGGATTAEWAVGTDYRWTKWDIGTNLFPDAAYILLGINDILQNITAAAIIANIRTIIAKVKSLGIPRVYLGIVPTTTGTTGARYYELAILNYWIGTIPEGVTGIIDFAGEVRLTAVPTLSTTLSASTIIGATSISTVASIPSGTAIRIGLDGTTEFALTGAPSGAGPYTIPLTSPAGGLVFAHSSGSSIITVDGALDTSTTVDNLHFNAYGNTRLAKALQ